MGSAHGQAGVDLQVEGGQQALVNRQGRQRGPEAMVMPVGARIQRAAAQGDATETPMNWTKTTQPPRPTAAPDRVTGADSLVTTQTHGGERRSGVEMKGGNVEDRRKGSGKTEIWVEEGEISETTEKLKSRL